MGHLLDYELFQPCRTCGRTDYCGHHKDAASVVLSNEEAARAGATSFTASRRFRCKKGHVFRQDEHYVYHFRGLSVRCCPFCWLDLVERECGATEELPVGGHAITQTE